MNQVVLNKLFIEFPFLNSSMHKEHPDTSLFGLVLLIKG